MQVLDGMELLAVYREFEKKTQPALSLLMGAPLCTTLYNPPDCGLPGSSVHGIFQATTLEWVAISSSR